MKLHVVKVGGSLLDLADLPDRIQNWRRGRDSVQDLLLVGGGREVDALRKAHASGDLGDAEAHWLAIQRMDENKRQLTSRLEGPLLSGMTALSVTSFLRQIEPNSPGAKLPIGWCVTSDSIAARIAVVLEADELHLLKSRLPATDEAKSLASLVEVGYIDPFMLQLVDAIPRTTVWDLRTDPAKSIVVPGCSPCHRSTHPLSGKTLLNS